MIVAIHQPCFLPWLGYMERMKQADLFILLDHVQFERRGYQSRTRICVDEREQWLTVPVQQHSRDERIMDKLIANPEPGAPLTWAINLARTLHHAYRNAPYLATYESELKALLETPQETLEGLNLALLHWLRQALDIDTPLVRSADLEVQGARSELILNLCLAVGADTYLAGMGGSRQYLDQEAFARAGVHILWQDFRPFVYPQWGSSSFIPGLSAVDLLFNMGPASAKLLQASPPAAGLQPCALESLAA